MRADMSICLFDPASIERAEPITGIGQNSEAHAASPAQSWWGRALRALAALRRPADEKSLRALAALDDDEVENLSEYGQRLRAAARCAEQRRRTGPWPRSPHE